MRLLPRHYIMLAVILGLGIFSIVRARHANKNTAMSMNVVPLGPTPSSSAWSAFDKAAVLRDAPDAQFAPALHDLQQAIDSSKNDPTLADVKGCETWLMFYRQNILHPSADTSWKQRSTGHLATCVQLHRDVGK